MPTTTLSLRTCRDGYYRTLWTCEHGHRHHKRFGRDARRAANRFSRFHAQWQDDEDVRCPWVTQDILTVAAAWERYRAFADGYYVHPDGRPTGEARNMADAFRPVLELFGTLPAASFGPRSLKAARERMIEDDLCLNVVNQRTNKIRAVFKWLASEELVSESVWVALKTVQGLPPGRNLARESEPVGPVANRWVWAVVAAVPQTVAAMIRVQYWSAARPGEVCIMRPCDLMMSDGDGRPLAVWRYTPAADKCAWRRRKAKKGRKIILIGPQAQEAIRPFLDRAPTAYLFSPAEAQRSRNNACSTHRHQDVAAAETDRRVGTLYTEMAYARAIKYACDSLGIPHWSPNQLRHTSLTRLGNLFSADMARIVAGHASVDTTETYLERDLARAANVIERAG